MNKANQKKSDCKPNKALGISFAIVSIILILLIILLIVAIVLSIRIVAVVRETIQNGIAQISTNFEQQLQEQMNPP